MQRASFAHSSRIKARQIVEGVLGRKLPAKAVVHHADENPTNNANDNLVVCPDKTYHNLLHTRLKAYKACGDPNKRRCFRCLIWDSIDNLQEKSAGLVHKSCFLKWLDKRTWPD